MKRQIKRILKDRKSITLLLSFVILCSVAVGGSLAWLAMTSDTVVNVFGECSVEEEIEEDFDEEHKKNVAIKNTGDIDCYVRVAFVFNWLDKDGNILNIPVTDEDISLVMTDSRNWKKNDGFYYYKNKLSPGETSGIIIMDAFVNTNNGYRLDFTIVSQAVQAEPSKAVKEAWGITPNNAGNLF